MPDALEEIERRLGAAKPAPAALSGDDALARIEARFKTAAPATVGAKLAQYGVGVKAPHSPSPYKQVTGRDAHNEYEEPPAPLTEEEQFVERARRAVSAAGRDPKRVDEVLAEPDGRARVEEMLSKVEPIQDKFRSEAEGESALRRFFGAPLKGLTFGLVDSAKAGERYDITRPNITPGESQVDRSRANAGLGGQLLEAGLEMGGGALTMGGASRGLQAVKVGPKVASTAAMTGYGAAQGAVAAREGEGWKGAAVGGATMLALGTMGAKFETRIAEYLPKLPANLRPIVASGGGNMLAGTLLGQNSPEEMVSNIVLGAVMRAVDSRPDVTEADLRREAIAAVQEARRVNAGVREDVTRRTGDIDARNAAQRDLRRSLPPEPAGALPVGRQAPALPDGKVRPGDVVTVPGVAVEPPVGAPRLPQGALQRPAGPPPKAWKAAVEAFQSLKGGIHAARLWARSRFTGQNVDALRQTAAAVGVDVTGLKRKGEVVQALVDAAEARRPPSMSAEQAGQVKAKAIELGMLRPDEAYSPERVRAAEDLAQAGARPEEVAAMLERLPASTRPDGTIAAGYLPSGEALKTGIIEPAAIPAVEQARARGIEPVTSGTAPDGTGWAVGVDGKGIVRRVEAAPKVAKAPPPEDAPLPRAERVEGAETSIPVEGGEPVRARYALMEAKDIRPSHDPTQGFRPTEGYPTRNRLQERDYGRDQAEQGKVLRMAGNFRPDELLNTSPRATEGPSTVGNDGVVINGNGREMGRRVAAQRDGGAAYRHRLMHQARHFGLTPEQVNAMRDPVLVRVVDVDSRSPEAARFGRQGNITATQSVSPIRRAVRHADLVDDAILSEVASDPDATFAAIVTDPHRGRGFREALSRRIPASERPEFFKEDGSLTEAGKELAQNVLLAKALTPEQMESLSPDMRRTLTGSVPQLVEMARNPELKDYVEAFREAVDFTGKKLEGGRVSPRDYFEQGQMFEAPAPLAPDVRAFVDFLHENRGAPRRMRERLSDLLKAQQSEAGLFAEQAGTAEERVQRNLFATTDSAAQGSLWASRGTPPLPSPAAQETVRPGGPAQKAPRKVGGEAGFAFLPDISVPFREVHRFSAWVKQRTVQYPHLTRENPAASTATSAAASSHILAKALRSLAVRNVVERHGVKAEEFGAAMTEDNLRGQMDINAKKAEALEGGARSLRSQAAENKGMRRVGLENQAKADEAAAKELRSINRSIEKRSLVGADGAPANLATESAYQAYLALPEVRAAAKSHEAFWDKHVEPMYRQRQGMRTSDEPAQRGRQLGGRMSLLAETELAQEARAAEDGPPPPSAMPGSLRNKNVTKSPYSHRLVGSSKGYVHDYGEIMASKVNREVFGSSKRAAMDALVRDGDAALVGPGQTAPKEIKGEPVVPFTDVVPSSEATIHNPAVPPRSTLYVRESLAPEIRRGWKMDVPRTAGPMTKILGGLNTASLQGLADNFINMARGLTVPFVRPMSGRLKTESVLNAVVWPAQAVRSVWKTIKAVRAVRADLDTQVNLAKIGAWRNYETKPLTGTADQSWIRRVAGVPFRALGRVGNAIDMSARYRLNQAFDALVKSGHTRDTPTNRRDFVNQVGNYVRGAQGAFVRTMVDSGIGPFTNAKVTRWANRFRVVSLDPGAAATSPGSRLGMAVEMLTKMTGALTTVALANMATTGSPLGRRGVPFGSIDTGGDDEQGRPLHYPLLDVVGLGDALKMVGGQAYITAKRRGLKDVDALESAMRQAANQGIGFFTGPGPTAAAITLTGENLYGFKVVPEGQPGESEFARRLVGAGLESTPLARLLVKVVSPEALKAVTGQTAEEGGDATSELRQQVAYFLTRPGMKDEAVDTLPDRVRGAQLNEFIDDLKRRIGAVNEDQRSAWLTSQTEGLTEDESRRVWAELRYRLGNARQQTRPSRAQRPKRTR